MKKFYWLWIGIITFVFGVIIVAIWIKFNPPVYTYEEVISAEVPKTNYCDLVNDPYKYDGKIVRVHTKLNWFMHGYFLADDNCSGAGDEARTAISFYQPKRESLSNSLEEYRKPGKMWEPLEIVAVGVFNYKLSLGGSDGIQDRTHLHFEIYNIEYSAR